MMYQYTIFDVHQGKDYQILIFPFPVLHDLDLKIIRGLLFITNPFMKSLDIWSTDRQVQSNTPLFFEGGHNVKTRTQDIFFIQNFNEIKTDMQLCNVKQIKLKIKMQWVENGSMSVYNTCRYLKNVTVLY
jgi:hypothetical protein